MEVSANVLCFLCMFTFCKTTEIPRAYATNVRFRNEDVSSENNKKVEAENQYSFHKRNDTSPLPPHTNTKWSPWTPIPGAHQLNYNFSDQKHNNTVLNKQNSTNSYNTTHLYTTAEDSEKNNVTLNSTILADNTSNTTKDSNSTSRNQKSTNLTTVPSETTKSMSNSYHRNKNHVGYSKGVTYYFWDTIYYIFKCFKDHWKTGVVDCVTARASTLLDGILGFGSQQPVITKEGFHLIPFDDDLEETPRNDEDGLPIEEDEEEEEEVYDDDGGKDSREAGRRRRRKNRRRKLKGKHMFKILHVVVSTALMALPVIIALKLKFFMMLSVGIAALSLVSGKAFILSMVSFVLAIVAVLKKATHKGYSISRVDDLGGYHPSYASRKGLEDVYTGGRSNSNYFM